MHVKKILGFAALGAFLVFAAPVQQAQAATPVSPGIATAVQGEAGKLTTEVRHRRNHRHHRQHRRWHRPHHHYGHHHFRTHRHYRPHHHRHWR